MRRDESRFVKLATAPLAGVATVIGRVTFQAPPGKTWTIDRLEIAVVLASASVQPKCFLYKNAEIPPNQIDATYQGSRNATRIPIVLDGGDILTVLWTDGTVGDLATAIAYLEET